MSKVYKHQNVIELTIANPDDTLTTLFMKYFKQIAKKFENDNINIASRLGTAINVF